MHFDSIAAQASHVLTVEIEQKPVSERRGMPRYPHGDLDVQVHKPGLRGVLRTSYRARCVDFSLSGLQVDSRQQFKIGEQVIIDLHLLDVFVQEMNGVICTARPQADGYRYGLRFCFEAGKHMRTSWVSDCLRRIAGHLKQLSVYS